MPLDMQVKHLKELQMILEKHAPNYEVFAFGSRVKGSARENSDLDLCIKGQKMLDFTKLSILRDALSESSIPYKIDLIDWHATSKSFREIIEEDSISLTDHPLS